MNNILSFSVPVNSLAATILSEWQNKGLNRSDQIRAAIERHAATEADRRRIVALSWALARRGICPVALVPETIERGTARFPNPVSPRYVMPHSCEQCEKYTGTPMAMERAGMSPHFAQSVIQPLIESWRDFQYATEPTPPREE